MHFTKHEKLDVRGQVSVVVTLSFLQSSGKEASLEEDSSGLFQSLFQGGMNNPLQFLLFCTDYKESFLVFRCLRILQICKPSPRHPAEHAMSKPVGSKPGTRSKHDHRSIIFSFM